MMATQVLDKVCTSTDRPTATGKQLTRGADDAGAHAAVPESDVAPRSSLCAHQSDCAQGTPVRMQHATAFTDLNYDVLFHLAQFLSARDLYALLRTARALWNIEAASKQRLLRQAMLSGLRSSFASLKLPTISPRPTRITLEDLFPTGAVRNAKGELQVLLSGSTVVQAMVGGQWECDDVDVFTTWEAADAMRERITAVCRLVSLVPDYGPITDSVVSSMNCIDHVEEFAYRPSGFTSPVLTHSVADKTVQLIVGKPGVSDARDLTTSFDLTICKSFYDGSKFFIADPARSLCCETTRPGARKVVVDRVLAKGTGSLADKLKRIDYSNMSSCWMGEVPAAVWSAVGLDGKYMGLSQCLFVSKLIKRIQKYQSRGIRIVDFEDDPECKAALEAAQAEAASRFTEAYASGRVLPVTDEEILAEEAEFLAEIAVAEETGEAGYDEPTAVVLSSHLLDGCEAVDEAGYMLEQCDFEAEFAEFLVQEEYWGALAKLDPNAPPPQFGYTDAVFASQEMMVALQEWDTLCEHDLFLLEAEVAAASWSNGADGVDLNSVITRDCSALSPF